MALLGHDPHGEALSDGEGVRRLNVLGAVDIEGGAEPDRSMPAAPTDVGGQCQAVEDAEVGARGMEPLAFRG